MWWMNHSCYNKISCYKLTQKHPKKIATKFIYTVRLLNNGQVGSKRLVHYSEVVLYWEVFIMKTFYLYTMLYETGSAVRTLLR